MIVPVLTTLTDDEIYFCFQEPFVFDIEGEMYEYRSRTHRMVEQFPPPGKHGDWQLLLHKMVSSYLVSIVLFIE